MRVIDSFRGDHYFLSNFYPARARFRVVISPRPEHAFMSARTTDERAIERTRTEPTPAEAKLIGRSVALVEDWDRIRFDVMADVLAAKFDDVSLARSLVATGGAILIEGNTWHDQFWGSCTCDRHRRIDGDNALGVLLMYERIQQTMIL
ncbi:NADAR family protein [Tsukamurella hominis]|uniref:NADAR family protein n=1 Tax=Tsukamurella hominis TaxID=1970232 RepID=UPI0039EC7C69